MTPQAEDALRLSSLLRHTLEHRENLPAQALGASGVRPHDLYCQDFFTIYDPRLIHRISPEHRV